MRKFTQFFIVSLSFWGIISDGVAFGREVRRSSKTSKASNFKDSAGLRVNKSIAVNNSSNTGLKCGQNAQPNANGSECECLDPVNYVKNTLNPTECFQKTDPVVIAQKKACGNVFLNAVNNVCRDSFSNNGLSEDKSLKCYDANDLFLKFDTSTLIVYINGVQYEYDKVCYLYTEDLAKSIAEDFSITGINSPNCKLKRVVAEASNECFQAVLAAGKSYGATQKISSDLQNICGYTGLHAKWAQLFGEDDSSRVKFPKNIPDLYLHAGKIGAADGSALVGNFLDGKITDKTNTWERDITQILNSHLNDVGEACGKEYEISMHKTDIQILDEKSSLQRQISEKGAIKGAQDWAMTQASVFIGEDKANKAIKKGIFGSETDEKEDASSSGIEVIDGLSKFDISDDDEEKQRILEKINSSADGRYLLMTKEKYLILDVKKGTSDSKIEKVKHTVDVVLPRTYLNKIVVDDLKEATVEDVRTFINDLNQEINEEKK